MPKSSSVTDEKIAEAKSLYMKGSTLKEIAAKHGYSVSTWHKLLREQAAKGERAMKTSERDLEMLAAHKAGQSFGQMAAERKMTRQRAHQIVKRTQERVDRQKRAAMVVGK